MSTEDILKVLFVLSALCVLFVLTKRGVATSTLDSRILFSNCVIASFVFAFGVSAGWGEQVMGMDRVMTFSEIVMLGFAVFGAVSAAAFLGTNEGLKIREKQKESEKSRNMQGGG